MATDLETRKPTPKTEAFLRRKFAELAVRIQRVDLVAHLLAMALVVSCYALAVGVFDWYAGNSTAAFVSAFRWSAGCVFLAVSFFLLARTVRCFFRRVNPYYVAHQLEQTLPDAKNGLINWLDLHDEELPSAFQKNLSARAAEQWKDGDADQIVKKRKNWILLSLLAGPVLGLLVLLILDAPALLASLRRAFVPINAPAPVARTQITLLKPEGGDVEVNPTQSVMFAATIEGRVPMGNRPDAPKLHWRYQEDEDFATLPLLNEGAGLWTAQLSTDQLRTGFTYKLSAGDAETAEHQVRVRAYAHVQKFEITYHHRAYRKLPKVGPTVFPNPNAAKPHLHGPRGTEVEMVVRTSRPVKTARVEFIANKAKKNLPIEILKSDPRAFVCRFTLEQSGQFRVAYTATDGEENADRELFPINVQDDELPRIVLTRPGKDIELPENGTLLLEGTATSPFGVRGLTLQMRVIDGMKDPPKLLPHPYRPDKSFQLESGAFSGEIEYMDFVALDQLKVDKGRIHYFAPGTVIEYWLEAADGADYPNAAGNIGKSATYKVKLFAKPKDQKPEEAKRKEAARQKSGHEKEQDDKLSKKEKDQPSKGGSGGADQNPEDAAKEKQKKIEGAKPKLQQALDQPQQDKGEGKGADPKNSETKGGQGSPDAAEPKQKEPPSMPPDDAGHNKQQNGGASGEAKDGGAKDKGNPETKGDGPTQGNAKGIDQNGPEPPSPDQQNAKNGAPPPNLQAKAGTMNDSAAAKSEPKEGPSEAGKGPGQTRDDAPKMNPKQPSWDDIAKKIDALPEKGANGEAAAKDLADIGRNADDLRKQEIAKEALQKNGRDPATGKKVPNPYGSGGQTAGIADDLKAAAANRAFAARIGQMQLDDWQKRITPDLLKKAGMTEADWLRFVKNTQSYDALVRQWNAQIARKALKDLAGPRTLPGPRLNAVESTGTSNAAPANNASQPPELRDAQQRFTTRP